MLHAAAELGRDVCFEMQRRDAKKPETDGQFAAEKVTGVLERGQWLLDVGIRSDADGHEGMALIRRDVYAGHRGRADARIGQFVTDHFGKLLAQRFRDPFGAMVRHSSHSTLAPTKIPPKTAEASRSTDCRTCSA